MTHTEDHADALCLLLCTLDGSQIPAKSVHTAWHNGEANCHSQNGAHVNHMMLRHAHTVQHLRAGCPTNFLHHLHVSVSEQPVNMMYATWNELTSFATRKGRLHCLKDSIDTVLH